jgi:hypothetical protein
MLKPKIKPGDYHWVVSDSEARYESTMKVFDSNGKLLHQLPCLAKGQTPNYRKVSGDTPPGLYRIGAIVPTGRGESASIWNAYGAWFLDLEGMEQNEEQYGRAGCGCHGGGTGAKDPLAPYQQLLPTLGCIRTQNADLANILVPIAQKAAKSGNTVYVSVFQN